MFEGIPPGFDEQLGLHITEAGPDRVVGTLDAAPHHQQPYGVVHGGVYCTIVESLCSTGAALWAMDQGMAGVVGVANATDFLRAHRTGRLTGEATPIHRGRRQQLWETVIRRDGDGKPVARGTVRLQNLASADEIGGFAAPGS